MCLEYNTLFSCALGASAGINCYTHEQGIEMTTGKEVIDEYNSKQVPGVDSHACLSSLIDRAIFDARREEKEKLHKGLKDLESRAGTTGERNGVTMAANYVWVYGV